jgi:hypothetical protein
MFFDSEDFEDPLKSYFDVGLNWIIMPGYRKIKDVFVRYNEFEGSDSIFPFSEK